MDRNELMPRNLLYLRAIHEHGSFTRAAEALNVSQPTLSQQIKQLEETLDSQLIDRAGRNVRLTDAGAIYLSHVCRALSELSAGTRAIKDVQDLSRGVLRLAWTPITNCLTCSLLAAFNRRFPGILLTATELPQIELEAAVANAKVDVGIAFSEPASVLKQSSGISSFTLLEDTLSFAVSDGHELAGRQFPITPEEQGDLQFGLLNSDFALRRMLDEYFYEQNIAPQVVMESNSLNAIVEIVRLGTLATVLPEKLVVNCKGFQKLVATKPLPRHKVSLIWHEGRYISAAARAFKELGIEWSRSLAQDHDGFDDTGCIIRGI